MTPCQDTARGNTLDAAYGYAYPRSMTNSRARMATFCLYCTEQTDGAYYCSPEHRAAAKRVDAWVTQQNSGPPSTSVTDLPSALN